MAAIAGQRYGGKRDNLPVPPAGDHVPAIIADNPQKLELWRFIVADLQDRHLWSPTYTLLVQEMINCVVRLGQIVEIVDNEGLTVDKISQRGLVIGSVKHPLLSEESVLRDKLLKFIEKLGMSPRDIVFLTNPDAPAVLDAQFSDPTNKITYFRD